MLEAFSDYFDSLVGIENFLPEVLLVLLAFLTIIYAWKLRRIRLDLRLFQKSFQDGVPLTKGSPELPEYCSRDIRNFSDNLNAILKHQAHRAHWMQEFLLSTETRLNSQAETRSSLFKSTQKQKDLSISLQAILSQHFIELEKLFTGLTELLSCAYLQDANRNIDTVIAKMKSTLDRMMTATQMTKTFEESAGKYEEVAPLFDDLSYALQDLSLNTQLAASQNPGSPSEMAVVAGSNAIEEKIKTIAGNLAEEAVLTRKRTARILSAQRDGNTHLLESSQHLDENRRNEKEFFAFMNASIQKAEKILNDGRDQMEKALSILNSFSLETEKSLTAIETENAILEETIYAVGRIRANFSPPDPSKFIKKEMGAHTPENGISHALIGRQTKEF